MSKITLTQSAENITITNVNQEVVDTIPNTVLGIDIGEQISTLLDAIAAQAGTISDDILFVEY